MRVQSIRTPVEVGDIARDRLLDTAREVSFREVDRVAELHDLAEKVGPVTEAFEYAWHLLTAGVGTPLVIHLGDFTGCIRVFDECDLAENLLFSNGGFVGHRHL